MKAYFKLFACCIPVKGARRSVICDLQRDRYQPIPTILYYILTRFHHLPVEQIKANFDHRHNADIDAYLAFLDEQELGFWTDEPQQFPALQLKNWHEAKAITNAVVDFAPQSTHSLTELVPQLSELGCDALELRFFYSLALPELTQRLEAVKGSTLRSVEVVVGYDPSLSSAALRELHQHNPRVRKLTIHSAGQATFAELDDFVIIYTPEQITSEKCCGSVSPWYFTANTHLFSEAQKFNSCLNRKIGVDQHGLLRNCPSMPTSFGHVDDTPLRAVLQQPDFTAVWAVNKDQVEVCRDCEFRYICQDCRAYTLDATSLSGKPAKCSYDPYAAVWGEATADASRPAARAGAPVSVAE
ncbi:grasp-with-spasm system SPASM domain peptide maturase [Hymenobacter oligotrophus]|uniref:grasp-with-spasm system SPASM domain peptide maturase n=1 Tax=Hymenobacter oligotrophus TaxID=2319843 RepID=UPI0013C2A98C|nr:grasp-with-spasm system SPASM domain peptide maturase [Hymenobacter oligotrophus]